VSSGFRSTPIVLPVQRLKVATLPLHLPCYGPVTHSREILTNGKSHRKKLDTFSLNDDMDMNMRTAGYIWTDYKTNTQIAKELKITPILDKLLEYKRNWILYNM
jgi:hypothetical protein